MPLISLYEPSFDSGSRDFKTHLNYIKCLENVFQDLSIEVNVSPSASLDTAKYKKFENLYRITRTSIDGEIRSCDVEISYSQVVAPWLPVKCYYMIYYLESILIYLLQNNPSGFGPGGHTRVRSSLLNAVRSSELSFNGSRSSLFTEILVWQNANSFYADSGSNLSPFYFSNPDCINSLKKKISDYIEYDWKSKKRILNFKTKKSREERRIHLFPKEFLLLDYFYWMRIKANYRDIDFLDFDIINEIDAREYITKYISVTNMYCNILLNSIAALKVSRRML